MMRMSLLFAVLAFFAVICSAEDAFNLKFNMLKLNAELGEVREKMIRNDREGTLDSLGRLKKDVNDLLSNRGKIEALLPAAKRDKADVAVEAAGRIAENIEIIEDAFGANKRSMSALKVQAIAQRAYTSIEIACFHCHNLVRDQ